MPKKLIIIAGVVILLAAVVGGTIGSSRGLRRSVSGGGSVPEKPAEDIEKDYNEAVSTIAFSYAGEIDYEKATQAAVQGMLSTLATPSMYFPYSEFRKLKED